MLHTSQVLRELREGGLSQTEISKLTGVPQSRLSKWENHGAPASADDALKLALLRDQRRAAGLMPSHSSTESAAQGAAHG